MTLSRRSFLQVTAGATLGVYLTGFEISQVTLAQSPDRFSFEVAPNLDLTPEIFSQFLNTTFEVSGPGINRVPLTLIQVTDQSDHVNEVSEGRMTFTTFTLRFKGARTAPLKQNTYQFNHYALGILPMFIVPGGQDASGKYFNVVYNRITGYA
ncbi:MAG TPA: hypothetical protein PLS70_06720 [Acidobacteriota bacterium]|nr:hypothetical protein [Acidobacteriota bacterium]